LELTHVKILVTGITGLRNRGVEALLITTVQQLEKRIPGVEVQMLTPTADYDAQRLVGHNAKAVRDNLTRYHRGRVAKLRVTAAPLASALAPGYLEAKKLIASMNMIVASGGDVFSSDYSRMASHLFPLKLAIDAGVPFMLLAQSIGPFKTDAECKQFTDIARHAKLITVREKPTLEYCIKTLNLPASLVTLTADPAFLLPRPTPAQIGSMLSCYGINPAQPFVAFAPSQGISQYAKFDRGQHLRAWLSAIRHALDAWKVPVLLVPHVQEIVYSNDDRILATDLLRELNFDSRVRLAGGDHTASEFKGMISASTMVVAERMHAAIAGLSTGVCTVPVGYSVKAAGIMGELFPKGFDDLLIAVQKFLDPAIALPFLDSAWQRRDAVAAQLKETLPTAQREAGVNFDMIASAVGSNAARA
jgi:colanic acid/amylovoran biosynthesis protein